MPGKGQIGFPALPVLQAYFRVLGNSQEQIVPPSFMSPKTGYFIALRKSGHGRALVTVGIASPTKMHFMPPL
jgi:hypothetical protein